METVRLICIGCPMGCPLEAEIEGGEVKRVTGNTCPRGDAYARKEVTHPTRIVTSTVRVYGSASGAHTLPCKTRTDVPKDKVFDVVRALKGVAVAAPVRMGDVVLRDAAGTGVDIVATAEVK